MNEHNTLWSMGKGYGSRVSMTSHRDSGDGTPVCGAKARRWMPGPARVTCVKCAAKEGAVVGNADTVLRPDSLLSAKDQRTLHPAQQIRKLRNIAKRALAHADWMHELATSQYAGDQRDDDRARCAAERDAAMAKARKATSELLAVARASDDPRVRRLA